MRFYKCKTDLEEGNEFMGALYFYGSIIAGIVLYVNTVSILKKVKKEESTFYNTIVGCICTIVILTSIFVI